MSGSYQFLLLIIIASFLEFSLATWTSWTPCTKTCGGGRRERRCLVGPGQFCFAIGGVQNIACNPQNCPGWSTWLSWTTCTGVQCGFGRQTRTRTCPAHSYCPGLRMASRTCGVACTTASFTHWGEWSGCSKSCDVGSRRRTRTCQVGLKCRLPDYNEEQACNVGPCAAWNKWNQWSACSRTCDGGERKRFRACKTGSVNSCPGNKQEDERCNTKICGGWTGWTPWSACSKACGVGGHRNRVRNCVAELNADLTAEGLMDWITGGNKRKGAGLQEKLKHIWKVERLFGKHPRSAQVPDLIAPIIGDMLIDEAWAQEIAEDLMRELQNATGSGNRNRGKRNMVNPTSCTYWPLDIKYQIVLSQEKIDGLMAAIDIYHATTCLNFIDVGSNNPMMRFVQTSSGCFAPICYATSVRQINLGTGCATGLGVPGIPWHEIAHTLGMKHEQSREDRDNYVQVLLDNVKEGKENNFVKCPNCVTTTEYDFESVMHYGKDDFAINGSVLTLMPLPEYALYLNSMGIRREGPTFNDVLEINNIYCPETCAASGATCVNGGYRNPSNCNECLCPQPYSGATCSVLQTTERNCGGTLMATGEWQPIETLDFNYPTLIQGELECFWKIEATNGLRIEFEFTEKMHFGYRTLNGDGLPTGTCSINYVEVKYLEDITVGGVRYCNISTDLVVSDTITSKSNYMFVIFKSTSPYVGYDVGFRGRYRTVGTTTEATTTETRTTEAPTTETKTTEAPTTETPTTETRTTEATTTETRTTEASSTETKTTEASTPEAKSTEAPTTETQTTEAPTTETRTTEASTTETKTTEASTTEAKSTETPTTETRATEAPTTETPTTETRTTEAPTTETRTTEASTTETKTTEASTTETKTTETQKTKAPPINTSSNPEVSETSEKYLGFQLANVPVLILG